MSEPESFRGYYLVVTVHHTRWPSSGYFEVGRLMSEITYQLSFLGRPLTADQVTAWTKELDEWTGYPSRPWTYACGDVSVIVRLAERFTGWGPDGRPL